MSEIKSVLVSVYFTASPCLLRCLSVTERTMDIFIDSESFARLGFRLTYKDKVQRALSLAGVIGRVVSSLAHSVPVEDVRGKPGYLPKRLGSPPDDFLLAVSAVTRAGPYPAFWSALLPADPSAPYLDLETALGAPEIPRSRMPCLSVVANRASRNQWAGRHMCGDRRTTQETLAILIERRLLRHGMLEPARRRAASP